MGFWTKNREFPERSVPLLHKITDFVSMSSLLILSLKLSGYVPKTANIILTGLVLIGAMYILFFGSRDENLKCVLRIIISVMSLIIGGIIAL